MKIERTVEQALEDVLDGYEVTAFEPAKTKGTFAMVTVNQDTVKQLLLEYLRKMPIIFVDGLDDVEIIEDVAEDATEKASEPSENPNKMSKEEFVAEMMKTAENAPESADVPLPTREPTLKGTPLSEIRRLYVDEGMSAVKIAEHLDFGISGKDRVRKFLVENGIKRNKVNAND